MKCRLCDGKGTLKGKNTFPFTCPACEGTKESKACAACKGLGHVKSVVCSKCRGNGFVPKGKK